MIRYIKGTKHNKAHLMDGDKRIELSTKALEMGYTRDYLRERLNILSVEDALNPSVGMSRLLARPAIKQTIRPTFTDNGNLYKFMSALSLVRDTSINAI